MNISRAILKLFGWEIIGTFPPDLKKALVIGAPHTSNWDFILAILTYRALGFKARYLLKKEAFVFPLSLLYKWLGAIPVDRRPGNTVVDDVVREMKKTDKFLLTITPEGTRSRVENWKPGFWKIAKGAGVPVFMGAPDYPKKKIYIFDEYPLTDSYKNDVRGIRSKFKAKWARYPEKFAELPQEELEKI